MVSPDEYILFHPLKKIVDRAGHILLSAHAPVQCTLYSIQMARNDDVQDQLLTLTNSGLDTTQTKSLITAVRRHCTDWYEI